MAARDVPFLQGGTYTATETRRVLTALTGARDFTSVGVSTAQILSAGGGHGVVGTGDMAVTAGAGTTVVVAAGLALVRGTQQADQGVYITSNDAPLSLTITAADATNPRKDLIVSRVRDAEFGIAGNDGPIQVVTGVPTSGLTAGTVTGRPTPPENSLLLAEVFVPVAAIAASAYIITDLRTRAVALGGVLVCTTLTRPDPVTEGQVIYETDTDRVLVFDGTAWTRVGVGGVLVVTSTTRPSPATEGQVIYETDTDRLLTFDGTNWNRVGVGGVLVVTSTTRPSPATEGQVIYETDTDRVLTFDGTNWINILGRMFETTVLAGVVPTAAQAREAPRRRIAGSTSVTVDGNGNGVVFYPTAFPNGLFSVVISNGDGVNLPWIFFSTTTHSLGSFGFTIRNHDGFVFVNATVRVNWIAEGW